MARTEAGGGQLPTATAADGGPARMVTAGTYSPPLAMRTSTKMTTLKMPTSATTTGFLFHPATVNVSRFWSCRHDSDIEPEV